MHCSASEKSQRSCINHYKHINFSLSKIFQIKHKKKSKMMNKSRTFNQIQ